MKKKPATKPEEFTARVDVFVAVVCTSLPIRSATVRLNREHPTGTTHRWSPGRERQPAHGSACLDHPGTHRHYLFTC